MPFVNNIGIGEIFIVLVIALIVIGPKKLPDVARSLGHGMREFRQTINGARLDDDDDEIDAPATRAK